ncbi:MAG: capsular biosynthesis protein [Rhodocyclaceae bacterium]|nr:capsular biosynthesis protein [Rhodocyclaceae bacterium]
MDGSVILERLGDRRRILLLQGPIGPFFGELARFLLVNGREVTKVHLNGGDAWFYDLPGAVDFKLSPDHWPHFIDNLISSRRIDAIVLFGDCRPYHRAASLRARMRSVPVFVFEEGYIRPNYVTFESGGVNGFSMLPRSLALLRTLPAPLPEPRPVKAPFSRLARYAMTYYLAGRLRRGEYPNYRHHKPFEIYPEMWYWVRAGLRKHLYRVVERKIQARLTGVLAGKFFLVPLQVYNDSQVRHHSDFRSVRAFIAQVLNSFARSAPDDCHLVFKHHPMDRGHRDYGRQIREQAEEAGLSNRVLYIHDQHLPSLLKAARGVVVINSTVGLSALFHGAPVKVLGRCIYDLPGLTHQGKLESFWQQPEKASREFFGRYRDYLVHFTQVNGSFYSGESIVFSPSALEGMPRSLPMGGDMIDALETQEAA